MISVKCFVLLLPFSACDLQRHKEVAGDFTVAMGKEGPEESLELLQMKQTP